MGRLQPPFAMNRLVASLAITPNTETGMNKTPSALAAALLFAGAANSVSAADLLMRYQVAGLKPAPVIEVPETVTPGTPGETPGQVPPGSPSGTPGANPTQPPEEQPLPEPEPEPERAYLSCLDIKTVKPETASGVYSITVGGNAFDAYCDMESAGGGWTMVVAQFDVDPVRNWNEGIQGDYDPTLSTRRGFALSSAQIPSHTQTGFGRDHLATYADYANYTYTTGDIPAVTVSGFKGAYHIYRHSTLHYSFHDPEMSELLLGVAEGGEWHQTLSFDKVGGRFTWAFSPLNTLPHQRSYAMGGVLVASAQQDHAWTVWVR